MSVRRHEDVSRLVEDNLPVLSHAGPHTLGEEEDVVRVESEIVVLLEALDRRLIVRLRGHNIPRDRGAIADRTREDLAGVEVEERSAGDRTDRIAALGSVISETRSLSSGNEQRGNLAGLELLLAGGDGFSELLALQDCDLGGLALGGVGDVGAALKCFGAVLNVPRTDLGDLGEERLTILLAEFLPVGEDVFLSTSL